MQVLITGGTGFVGAHLVRRLLAQGHRVISLDKNPGLFDEELRSKGATLLAGSVTDAEDVNRAMAGREAPCRREPGNGLTRGVLGADRKTQHVPSARVDGGR